MTESIKPQVQTEIRQPAARKKPNNVRTGLLLGLVALAFFLGIFINRFMQH